MTMRMAPTIPVTIGGIRFGW